MKVLQINNQHYLKGGAHRVYLNTAKLLKDNGHDVFFFSLKEEQSIHDENEVYFPEAIDHRNSNIINKFLSIKNFISNKNTAIRLNEYLKKIKPEIAHVHLFMGGLTTSILAVLKDNNIPIIHTVHDYRLICPSYLFLDGNGKICEKCKSGRFINCLTNKCSEKSLSQSGVLALDAYYRKYINSPHKYIDKYIFVSRFIYNKHNEYQKGINFKSEILHNFISNLEDIKPNNEKGNYFLYLGRLSREKGVVTLINSAVKANINLKIVGNGPLLNNKDTTRNNKIEFLGFKKGVELWDIIKNASFIIIPSEWYENNPLSIIESYAYGKPVIGSKIGGIPEILKHDKTGFLFNHGNETDLKEVLLKASSVSKDNYKRLSKNARDFAENHFNPTKHYRQLINIYNEIIITKKQ